MALPRTQQARSFTHLWLHFFCLATLQTTRASPYLPRIPNLCDASSLLLNPATGTLALPYLRLRDAAPPHHLPCRHACGSPLCLAFYLPSPAGSPPPPPYRLSLSRTAGVV